MTTIDPVRDALDLREALAVCAQALLEAAGELEQLDEIEVDALPSPDPTDQIVQWGRERCAALATLAQIKLADPKRAGRLTVEQWQAELVAIYRAKMDEAEQAEYALGIPPMPAASVPVLDDVLASVREALERINRLRVVSRPVRDALDEINGGWRT